MNEAKSAFDWMIDEAAFWPPRGRPKPPLGPTTLEVLRSCPLRTCFECSEGYERRIGFAARVGVAFHHTLQALNQNPPEQISLEATADWARQKFLSELEKQELERSQKPRERGLPRDEMRVHRAIEAVITEAHRICFKVNPSHSLFHPIPIAVEPATGKVFAPEILAGVKVHVEIPIESHDRLFKGRIDRVEESPRGAVLYDYKAALRDDVPERYERQLQFYAWLWHEATGKWPTAAYVIYPFTETIHSVAISQETCEKMVEEYRALLAKMQYYGPAEQFATPGDVCQVCEFRPWCFPFWKWQSAESKHLLSLERASIGFEGILQELQQIEFHWKLLVRWRNCTIRIVAPLERFPQLEKAQNGVRIRALGMKLYGQMMAPQARVTEISELFLVKSAH
jgi:hypothetical protein